MSQRVLYLDLVGGAAGDMLMAALLDAGASWSAVTAAIDTLQLPGLRIERKEVHPAGLRALQVDVFVRGELGDGGGYPGHGRGTRGTDSGTPTAHGHDHSHDHSHSHSHDHDHSHNHGPHRPWPVVRELLKAAPLDDAVKTVALDAFARLAAAEAKAHGVDEEQVHFHEVGADDALADIVGVAAAFIDLKLDRVMVSPVPLGSGLTHGSHGPIPLPAPATLHILRGAELQHTDLVGETVTPTGAALLAALSDGYGACPSMQLQSIGVGAGHMSWPDRPNVVRALLGTTQINETARTEDEAIVEANLDDMSPELVPDLFDALFAAGALDVWSTPILMKKGRPALTVSALCRRSELEAVAECCLDHASTPGLRITPVARRLRSRRQIDVTTPYGVIRVKVSERRNLAERHAPEHDDCRRQAQEHAVPVTLVYEAALKAAWSHSNGET